jgi:phosphocarrier protein HPr
MLSQQVAIVTPNGFKVRPVTKYIKTCRSLKSDVTLTCNGKSVDSKSPSSLMSLALCDGDIVTLSVNGGDEEKALKLLVNLMENIGK